SGADTLIGVKILEAESPPDAEQPPDEDQHDRADDRREAARTVKLALPARSDETGEQRPGDAKQDRRDPPHVDRAGIEEARQRADEQARDDGAEDVDHALNPSFRNRSASAACSAAPRAMTFSSSTMRFE